MKKTQFFCKAVTIIIFTIIFYGCSNRAVSTNNMKIVTSQPTTSIVQTDTKTYLGETDTNFSSSEKPKNNVIQKEEKVVEKTKSEASSEIIVQLPFNEGTIDDFNNFVSELKGRAKEWQKENKQLEGQPK